MGVDVPVPWNGRGAALVVHPLSPNEFTYPRPVNGLDVGTVGAVTVAAAMKAYRAEPRAFLADDFIRNAQVYRKLRQRHDRVHVLALVSTTGNEGLDTTVLTAPLGEFLRSVWDERSVQLQVRECGDLSRAETWSYQEVSACIEVANRQHLRWLYLVEPAHRGLTDGARSALRHGFGPTAEMTAISVRWGSPDVLEDRIESAQPADRGAFLLSLASIDVPTLARWARDSLGAADGTDTTGSAP